MSDSFLQFMITYILVRYNHVMVIFLLFLFIYSLLPAFLDTGLPRGNGHERDSWVPCEVSSLPNPTTRKVWPRNRGLRPQLFSESGVGSFTSHKNRSVKLLWDGTFGFSSLSEKTRKSNHLQMSLQRQHFLLRYLKTLSVGPAGIWARDLPLSRPALFQLSLPGGGGGGGGGIIILQVLFYWYPVMRWSFSY